MQFSMYFMCQLTISRVLIMRYHRLRPPYMKVENLGKKKIPAVYLHPLKIMITGACTFYFLITTLLCRQ